MRGEIITWSPQKHVYCIHKIDQERSQRWADRVLSGLTGLESLDNVLVKHARICVLGLDVKVQIISNSRSRKDGETRKKLPRDRTRVQAKGY